MMRKAARVRRRIRRRFLADQSLKRSFGCAAGSIRSKQVKFPSPSTSSGQALSPLKARRQEWGTLTISVFAHEELGTNRFGAGVVAFALELEFAALLAEARQVNDSYSLERE